MEYRYLLVARFILINLISFAILFAIYLQGWLDAMFAKNMIELISVIVVVFIYGLVLCTAKIWRTSVELNDIKTGHPPPTSRAGKYFASIYGNDEDGRVISAETLRTRLINRISIVRHVANSLVFLGLIGTVIGFIIALSAVDPNATADADTVAPVIARLINGMSIALYTTLVGAVLHVWLTVNHRILSTGTVNLYSAIIELGESRGRA